MAHTKLGRGRITRRKECGGEENKDKLVPPLEGWLVQEEKRNHKMERSVRVCGGGGEGGEGRPSCSEQRQQAGHPGRRRCAPGRAAAARVGAGGGARCTVTGSCAPRPRGDIHWPAGPGSALAPRAAHGSAAAQGPRTVPRFAPSYFCGRWETAGGRLRVDGDLRLWTPGV